MRSIVTTELVFLFLGIVNLGTLGLGVSTGIGLESRFVTGASVLQATPAPTPTPSPSPPLSPGKANVIKSIDEYINSFQGTCFGSQVSLGDINKFKLAIAQNLSDPLTPLTNPTGKSHMTANKVKGIAAHDASKGTSPGRTSKVPAVIAIDLIPGSPSLAFKEKQTLMHEMTHHIEWLDGTKQPSMNNPPSERNTEYQDEVINALLMWGNAERRLRTDDKSMNSGLIGWRELEQKLANLEKGLLANGNNPGRGLPDKNLKSMTGFEVSFTTIQDGYIKKKDKNCGDRFRAMVYLAALLPHITGIDVEGPSDRDPVKKVNVGEAVKLSAEVVNSADLTDKEVIIPPSLSTSTRFAWKINDEAPVSGQTITFTPREAKKYEISVEFFITFERTEYFITSGEYELAVEPPKNPLPETTGKIQLNAPSEVIATDTVDLKSIIPPNLRPKAHKADWYPQSCAEPAGIESAKLSFRNPKDGKPGSEYISYVLRDANNDKLGEASATVLVKPVLFGGTEPGIWTASSGPAGVAVERQPAIRKFQDKDSGVVRARVEVLWADSFAPKTLQEIEAEMIKAKGGNDGLSLTPVTIAGFKGYLLERKEIKQGATGSGYVDLALPDTELGGWGYAIKNCIVIKFSYSATGGGVIRGEWWAVWWNDVPFIRSQTRAAASEAKSVLTSLTLGPNGKFTNTPYKGPKLDGSDTPIVKLVLSPDNKRLRKGDVINLQAVIENEENAEKPFKYDWSGDHVGSGASVQFLAAQPGKQRVGVVVPNIGGAAVVFEVEDLKAVIKQLTPASPKIMVGSPATFSAQLLSGGQPASGNYVYRWQPTPGVKFDPAEGPANQVKAVFARPGRQTVSVQILERKGEQLQILAQSESIEIDVTEDNRSNLKLAQAKELIPKGKLDEAIALAGEARELDPKNTEAATLVNKWSGDRTTIQNQLGKVRTLMDQGKFADASKELAVAKKLHPLYAPIVKAETELAGRSARDDAAKRESIAQVKRGNDLYEKGENAAAISSYNQALQADPKSAAAYAGRCLAKRNANDVTAANDCDSALRIDPGNATAYRGRSYVKRANNDLPGALADAERAIALAPNDYGGYLARGLVKAAMGDSSGAVTDYDRAIRLNPNYPMTYYNRSIAKINLKDNRGALADLNQFVTMRPTYSSGYNNRGIANERLGNTDLALADYQKAIDLEPNNETAKANLARLKGTGTPPVVPPVEPGKATFLPLDLTPIGGKKGQPHDLKGIQVDDGSYARLKSTDEKRLTYTIQVPGRFEAISIAVVSQLDDSIHMTDGMTIARMTVIKNTGEERFDIKAGIHSSEWNRSDGPKHKTTEPPYVFRLAKPGLVSSVRFDYVESGAEKWWGHAPGFVLKGLTLVGAVMPGPDREEVGSPNLALKKPARQSSTSIYSNPNDAQGAVDGTITGKYGFHTDSQANSWWQVDLGAVKSLTEIRIFNRKDCCYDRARTIQVLLSIDGSKWNRIFSNPGTVFGADGVPLRVLVRGLSARFVRLQLAETNYLHLDEIEVYGTDSQRPIVTPTDTVKPPVSTPTPAPEKPTPTPASKVVELLSSMNAGGVSNSPSAPAQFDTNRPYMITSIMTYHWNNGRGTTRPGTISIRASNGKIYGPYSATGLPAGSAANAFWEVKPNIGLPAGTYVIVDSDPSTWAHNSGSGGRGFTTIRGYLVTNTAVATSPPATTQNTPTSSTVAPKADYITAVFENRSSEAVHILGEEGMFGPENKLAPGERREVQLKMTPTGKMQFIAGRNGQIIAQKYWNGDPKNLRAILRVVFDGRGLQITRGSR